LVAPPPLEECLLDLDEAPVRVLEQREHRCADDGVDVRVLDRVVCSVVVLIDRLKPPNLRGAECGLVGCARREARAQPASP
jgi:hypothetical protein